MAIPRSSKIMSTSQRLAGISQYFLSEPEPASTGKQPELHKTQLLPILVDSELTQVFVYALARALHARGLTALVLHVESTLRSADPRSSSLRSRLDSPAVLRRHLEAELGGSKLPPRVCLIPVANSRDPHLREYQQALIAVGASLPALKRSYLSIKQLAGDGAPTRIGVIIVGATSNQDAHRYSSRLAAAAMRFLGRAVTHIGGVITPETATADPADNLGEVSSNSLNDIVEALIREEFLGCDPCPVDADVQKNTPPRTR